ncbi:tRNA-dihydrouridine(20) synthase [Diplonema papillatum]|nr:tRNA-dihydrouridine(20) synthase [Diplonema papillatum]|eukprot:gene11426-17578_t
MAERADLFSGKVVCGPMVRVSNLAFRLLAARSGAGAVFTEELVAQKLVKTERTFNPSSGAIEYILTEPTGKLKQKKLIQTLVFSTLARRHPADHPEGAPLVLQLGSNDPEAALAAALHVEADVDGIDLNMGCPKAFSIKGGMGAALLTEPDRACAILRRLVTGVSVPVSAKIRLLEDTAAMVDLLRRIAGTGVAAITIHARYRPQRSSEPPLLDELARVLAAVGDLKTPVILNGDVWDEATATALAKDPRLASVSGFMVARGALYNPYCFSPSPAGKLAAFSDYILEQMKYRGGWREVKYTMTRSFQDRKEFKAQYERMQASKTIPEMWLALGNDADDERFTSLWARYQNPVNIIEGLLIEEYQAQASMSKRPLITTMSESAVRVEPELKKRTHDANGTNGTNGTHDPIAASNSNGTGAEELLS